MEEDAIVDRPADDERDADYDDEDFVRQVEWASTHDLKDAFVKHSMLEFGLDATEWTFLSDEGDPEVDLDFFFLVSRTRHHSCAGHCFTIRSHCNFFRNATIPPGRIKQQRKTKQTATKQNQQRNTNQTQTENQTPEWKLGSLLLYNIQLK